MWKDHPILGIGFERSNFDFKPYLAGDAARSSRTSRRRRYPSLAEPLGRPELLARAARRHRRSSGSCSASRPSLTGLWLALRAACAKLVPGLVAAGFILVAAGTLERDRHRRGHPARRGHLARARAGRRRGGAGSLGFAPVTNGARHRRRRLHRLEPRARAARARRRGARARQLLDRVAREPRGARRSRSSRASCGSYERVHNAVRGADVVFHLGALGSVPRSVQDPLTSSAVNVEGTLNVLLAARDEGVRRVVFSSSTSVYGSSATLPTREDSPPDPISPYGVAKLAAERYCVAFSRVYEAFETVVLRYFNVFGPRQSPTSQYAAVGAALHHRDRRRAADHDPRRRRAVARLHLRRATSSRRRSRAAERRGRERPHLQRRGRHAGERQPGRRHDRRDPRAAGGEGVRGRRGRATSATRGPT